MMRRCLALTIVLLSGSLWLTAQNIGVENTAKYIGNGQYSWTVFVTGNPHSLAQVESVRYTLHPTFPQPIVWGRGANFAFTGVGWGEFNVVATIFYKNKQLKPTTINHWLSLFPRRK
jgi:transcription initiation factor IIF auxiliary subunit